MWYSTVKYSYRYLSVIKSDPPCSLWTPYLTVFEKLHHVSTKLCRVIHQCKYNCGHKLLNLTFLTTYIFFHIIFLYLFYFILFYLILFNLILYYIILFYFILLNFILYYFILLYFVLFWHVYVLWLGYPLQSRDLVS